MDQGLIPRRYAKALYAVGVERSDTANLYQLMQALGKAFADTPGLAATVANPFVSDADKTSLLIKAVGGNDGKPDATYVDFLKLLEKNKRTALARDIARAYVDFYRQQNAIYRVDICSAAPMGERERARLEQIIAKHVGEGTIEYNYTTDPSLIGGFTVTVNSERLDASVSSQLKQLRLKLLN